MHQIHATFSYDDHGRTKLWICVAQLSRRGSPQLLSSIPVDPRGEEKITRNREDVDAWIALLNFAQRKRFSNSDGAYEL